MTKDELKLSIVIVTYNRSEVLVDTIKHILELDDYSKSAIEIVIVDQTIKHTTAAESALLNWSTTEVIRWIKLDEPHLTRAMNQGLLTAHSELVLYLDDDIIPEKKLLTSHIRAHLKDRSIAVVVGQILQPGETSRAIEYHPQKSGLRAFMDFPFCSTKGCMVENAMAGNMSLKRDIALRHGGFDEQFIPPVAARFETEFAKRLIKEGEKIWFEPSGSIRHLAVSSGGTRAKGSHLNSAQAYFGFGDYYYAFKHGERFECIGYCVKRFFREVRTKYHLSHPWYIPVKCLGEIRAFFMAFKASRQPQKLIPESDRLGNNR